MATKFIDQLGISHIFSKIKTLLSGKADNDLSNVDASTARTKLGLSDAIIGLSVNGKVVTYTQADGGSGTITTQDTNTTYSNMTAATSSTAGKAGLVPAPAKGKQTSFLRGDGTWVVPTNTTYSNATTSVAGLMSASDKSKLDGIASGANAYTHPSYTAKSSGLYKVTVDSTGHVSATTAVAKSDITGLGIPAQDTTYSAATTSTAGLMSAADKSKLDGIAEGANKYTYTLPTASSTLGGVKTTSTVTSTTGLTACPIISGVPYYKDTNTTYSLSSFGITATAAELNYTDGVTSNIQTQLNGKLATSGTAAKATADASGNTITSTYATKTEVTNGLATKLNTSGGNVTGHVYLTGAQANSSTGNTSQIVFGAADNNHVAISSNNNALVINPDTASTTNQIVLYLDKASQFPQGISGNATSATKLQSSAGSATQPIYFSGGKPAACTYTLGASVPSDAKFTDTVYTLPNATSSVLGGVKIGSNITNSSGTISLTKANVTSALGYTPPTTNTTYSAATTSAAGLMSAADKEKLDGIASGANNYTYTLPTAGSTLGGVKTTSTVTSTSGLTACPIISGVPYYKDTNSTYTLSSFGVTATAAELNALDGITATVTELNYCDGVTGNIQTQLNGKLSTNGTAAKATADASGNNIVNTYAKKTELATAATTAEIDAVLV